MSIEYTFLDRGDDELIRISDLPVEKGIAIAVQSTGFSADTDETLRLAIVDFGGEVLFDKTVKPQNVEAWSDARASGGITPEDVRDAPELFQFEDEIISLFEQATIVVGLHVQFAISMIEASWVSLPSCATFDMAEQFCASHSQLDYPGQPAAVAALDDIAGYYGLAGETADAVGEAQMVSASYAKLVEEHARARLEKGSEHWEAYNRKMEEAQRNDEKLQEAKRMQEVKTLRISAIMWLCAAAIFSNLAVQMHVRGFDFGFVIVVAAAAVFFAVRWIAALYSIYKLRKRN